MRIPARLGYILERDQGLAGAVNLSLSDFEPWIKHSDLPFFPGYTDHGLEHLQRVLQTASGLIADQAWSSVTPADAAVLIVAVLLHDCAMHLSESSFAALITHPRSAQRVEELDEKGWDILWEEFLAEASRFDGRKLIRIFGDARPIQRPPNDARDYTLRDRLLIGEFLRRTHGRLAHEIALWGVPTSGGASLLLQGFSADREYVQNLSGLVARSHSLDLRSLSPYLETHFDLRQYKAVHAVFLMAVLRVADYLQLDADRAPGQVLLVKQLVSPVSQGEWAAHSAIQDIRNTHEDPEALYVDALPKDVRAFLRVRAWIDGIQHELGQSWAVLGEVFGRYEGLADLGLVLRRVRSSLENLPEFSKKVRYVPIKANFRAADADLLKLLIEPLYGDLPEVGIRELLQNAVDAVRERKQYERDLAAPRAGAPASSKADVTIRVDKAHDGGFVTVADTGIGMTATTIVEYFLTAGASFRRSDDWRKLFETDQGKAKVLRAGRFGVGALASFLLGSSIEVWTRHVEEKHGIQFVASVESEHVELRRCEASIGTTVRIRVTQAVLERLTTPAKPHYFYADPPGDWDWYCLASPSVLRIQLGNELTQHCILPDANKPLPPQWRRIVHPDFDDIQWTDASRMWAEERIPALTCNGIRIMRGTDARWGERFGLKLPTVSVFDPNAKLPLNLQRTALTSNYPFEQQLVHDVMEDFLAYVLVKAPSHAPKTSAERRTLRYLNYPNSGRGNEYRGYVSRDWYYTQNTLGYLDASWLARENLWSAVVLYLLEREKHSITVETREDSAIIDAYNDGTLYALDQWARQAIDLGFSRNPSKQDRYDATGLSVLESVNRLGVRLLLSDEIWGRTNAKLPNFLHGSVNIEWQGQDGCTLLHIGECPNDHSFDFAGFVRSNCNNLHSRSCVAEIYLAESNPTASPIGSWWEKALGGRGIPFDRQQRRTQLSTALQSLARFVKVYENAGDAVTQ